MHRPRVGAWHILAFSLSGALITGAMLTSVLVPAERHNGPRVEMFDRTEPCATCWTREAIDAWMKNGQDGAVVRL